jgi:hypothetical protein
MEILVGYFFWDRFGTGAHHATQEHPGSILRPGAQLTVPVNQIRNEFTKWKNFGPKNSGSSRRTKRLRRLVLLQNLEMVLETVCAQIYSSKIAVSKRWP